MDRDLLRQWTIVATYILTVVVNTLAVTLPLNGLTTAQISDRFEVLFVPAGYVFSIWSLIYVLLAAFTVTQALPRSRRDPELRALGYLPALTGILNSLWIFLWHFEVFVLTVPVMLALLLTLIAIHVRLRPARGAGGARRWLVALPFSVYLGWITVATIANITQMLWYAGFRGGPLSEEAWAVIMLAAGVAITVLMLARERDWAFSLVIVWAYVGIAAEQEPLLVVAAALLGAGLVAVLAALVLLRPSRPFPGSGAFGGVGGEARSG